MTRRRVKPRPERLELPTLCLEGRCSIRLSYGRKCVCRVIASSRRRVVASVAALRILIGARGFEPPTPCAQGRCATRLRHAPTMLHLIIYRWNVNIAHTKVAETGKGSHQTREMRQSKNSTRTRDCQTKHPQLVTGNHE